MSTTYRITIDQSAIKAPNFPRPTDWWRRFLPIWFTHDNAQWWTKDYATLVNDAVTVNEETGHVEIQTPERKHANQLVRYLTTSLRKYVDDTDAAIRLYRMAPTS